MKLDMGSFVRIGFGMAVGFNVVSLLANTVARSWTMAGLSATLLFGVAAAQQLVDGLIAESRARLDVQRQLLGRAEAERALAERALEKIADAEVSFTVERRPTH